MPVSRHTLMVAFIALSAAPPARPRAQAAGTLRIGVLTDLSGTCSDASGPTSVACARQAVQDFAGSRGLRAEVIEADHQNKPDVGAGRSAGGDDPNCRRAGASVQADVSVQAQAAGLFAEAARLMGPLAGLVNSAGISGPVARLNAREAAELERLLLVNVPGTMLCAREAVRLMSTRHGGQGGGIVNLPSVAARTGGFPGIAPYAATKGVTESFTKCLASGVAQEGIRVNAVAPGVVETGVLTPAMIEAARSTIPLGRAGQPNEVADAVAWLLSPASAYVTGSVVTVSGGR